MALPSYADTESSQASFPDPQLTLIAYLQYQEDAQYARMARVQPAGHASRAWSVDTPCQPR